MTLNHGNKEGTLLGLDMSCVLFSHKPSGLPMTYFRVREQEKKERRVTFIKHLFSAKYNAHFILTTVMKLYDSTHFSNEIADFQKLIEIILESRETRIQWESYQARRISGSWKGQNKVEKMANQNQISLTQSLRRENVSLIKIGNVVLSWEQKRNPSCVQGALII